MISNKAYDVLKWIAQFLLPGLATFYFAIASIWGLPYQREIVATIVAVDVWLASLLVVSNSQYLKIMMDDWKTMAGEGSEKEVLVPGAPFGMDAFTYNILKWVTLAFLPATGALYFTLSSLWNLPFGEQIVGTVAALTAFMGLLLGLSKAKFDQSQQ